MIDLNIILGLHRVLEQEPEAADQAAALAMLNITFAMHCADFNVGHAREVLIELHHKALETLAEFERDEKRPLN